MPTKKPKFKTFKLMCTWTLYQQVEVAAQNLDEAIDHAQNRMPIPPDGEYLADSFQVEEA